jgi:hypothetical protein
LLGGNLTYLKQKSGVNMSKFSTITNVASAAFVVLGVGVTSAFDTASQTVSVRAEVPLSCQVSLQGGTGEFNGAGVAELGSTREFCNSARGYQIFARAEGNVDGASIIVDGQAYRLTTGAEFAVVRSNGPAITSRTINYDAGDTDGGGRLTLRIQAN